MDFTLALSNFITLDLIDTTDYNSFLELYCKALEIFTSRVGVPIVRHDLTSISGLVYMCTYSEFTQPSSTKVSLVDILEYAKA